MVKRHESLIPLSQQHQHHLVYADRLKNRKPEKSKSNWPDNNNLEEQVKVAIEYFKEDMISHFELEEKIVFPVYEMHLDNLNRNKDLLNSILEEHKRVKGIISQFESNMDSVTIDQMLALGTDIFNHIRKEERKLFEDIQKVIPTDELIEIGKELKKKSTTKCSIFL